jgi:UDP-N-acetylmuramoyl-tripeptide--D-alanyl-D-alanine ligase
MRRNAMAAVAAARAVGVEPAGRVDLDLSASRGQRVEAASGVVVVDDCYNANPLSMRAALDDLAAQSPPGRRIAVLGDMLELGPGGPALHSGLNEAIKANRIDLVYCCGPLMRNLWDALSTGKRGGYADSSAGLEAELTAAIRAGDAIMVKGSLGSKMKTVVNALEKRFPGKTARDEAAV